MANISEEPLEASMLSTVHGCAGEGLQFLGIDSANPEPKSVVEAIDAFVYQWQKGHRQLPPSVEVDDVPYVLGSLWGEQVVDRFGWEWAMMTLHDQDESRAPGVVSPDRALVIYPIHFVAGCLQDEQVDATIALSFNMLEAGRIGDLKPREYFNLMEGVQRIVPRE